MNWILDRFNQKKNCILGDEMGLGKTLQTISVITHLLKTDGVKPPILILLPLTLTNNWMEEFNRAVPSIKCILYLGNSDEREAIRKNIVDFIMKQPYDSHNDPQLNFDVMITTYEILLRDAQFIKKFNWRMLAVDEAHRLKNHKSVLFKTLQEEFTFERVLLLTGTPIQNSLSELWALLHFIMPKEFNDINTFLNKYNALSDKQTPSNKLLSESLHNTLRPYLLRRTKEEVLKDLPIKNEIILYTGMTDMQRNIYLSILKRDSSLLSSNKSILMNIVMNLRKCCNHPYFFDNMEPTFDGEYILGEHIINNCGKMIILDKLLAKLKKDGKKVLIFSQMTRMLDILQDYLHFRDYTYERLDGSIRSDERNLAVKNFTEDDSAFVFLLSTRAGGLGLNLTVADTVIFYDSDWNPQMDLQAQARVHRIGQEKPVTVIRLVTSNSAEEIILARAFAKMKLKFSVLDKGNFSYLKDERDITDEKFSMSDIIKYGLDNITNNAQSSINDDDIETILQKGKVVNTKIDIDPETLDIDETTSMYLFNGEDFSKRKDDEALNTIINTLSNVDLSIDTIIAKKRSKADELIEHEELDVYDENEYLHFVRGDVTKPQGPNGKVKIIAHCLDNSGRWGKGGLFNSIKVLPGGDDVVHTYENSTGKITLGSLQLIKTKIGTGKNDSVYICNLICQSIAKGKGSAINMKYLKMSLKRLCQVAIEYDATIHLPRIGERLPSTNYYSVERLIRSCLASKGIETYIYYHKKNKQINQMNEPDINKIPHISSNKFHLSDNDKMEIEDEINLVFKGYKFHLFHVGNEFLKLKQYIESNGGILSYTIKSDIDFIISSSQNKDDELFKISLKKYPNIPVLKPSFIYKSIENRALESASIHSL